MKETHFLMIKQNNTEQNKINPQFLKSIGLVSFIRRYQSIMFEILTKFFRKNLLNRFLC